MPKPEAIQYRVPEERVLLCVTFQYFRGAVIASTTYIWSLVYVVCWNSRRLIPEPTMSGQTYH